mgnify:FL=1|jgi:hypothetical protein
MKNIKITPYTIEGEWDWCDISAGMPQGWLILAEMCKGEHIWCFRADGVMTSQENGRTRYVVKYLFDHKKLMLTLDGYLVNNDGEPHTLIYEQYRVEFNTLSDFYLYDQEDVIVGMETESLRLRFQKILKC